jgi:Protein of unknown function (DUF3627)
MEDNIKLNNNDDNDCGDLESVNIDENILGRYVTSLARLMQDVVVKPRNTKLLHAFAVCQLPCNRYAFLRTQVRSLRRSIKRLEKSEKFQPVVIYRREYVPNSINVLNKIKETLPKNMFIARNNKIQLVSDCDERKLFKILLSSLNSAITYKTRAV